MDFRKEIAEAVSKNIKIKKELLEIPPDSKLGDYALPCFTLAKEKKQKPNEVAQELCEQLKKEKLDFLSEIKTVGPYVNFYIDEMALARYTLQSIYDDKNDYGKNNNKNNVMVEYPSPNTNKPLHLGHIRNMLIGNSVSRILKFNGNEVVQANLNNDRGVHICKSMLAYQKWGKGKEPDMKTDHFVGKYYVMFAEKAKEDDKLEEEAQKMLKAWEDGDKKTIELWKLMNAWAYGGFAETYEKLGISFDKYYYESELYSKGKDLVIDGLNKGIFEKDENGAIIVKFDDKGIPDKVLLRADGTSIYITQDLYLAKLKFDEFKLDKSIYVVGNEQNNHFKQLFKILEMFEYPWAKDCYHLSYGMVNLPFGKMKSREGTVVDADDIVQNMIDLAAIEVRKRYSDIDHKEVEKRAKIIGIGALKFFILKMDPHKDMMYDPKESISFEGETGPYVQYVHARINSILKKSEAKVTNQVDYSTLKHEQEKKLIKMLYAYPTVCDDAAKHLKPSLVCRYLLDLGQAFNEFYHSCPILVAEDELLKARLLLITCVKQVIKSGLLLLGIKAPDVM